MSTGSSCTGVGCRHPVMVRKVLFRLTSTSRVYLFLFQTGAQHSASAYSRARAEVDVLAPHPVPAKRQIRALRTRTLTYQILKEGK